MTGTRRTAIPPRAARVLGAVLALLAGAAALAATPAAAATPAGAASTPAGAAPTPAAGALVVTGIQPTVGAVEFFLAARGLPGGASLATAAVAVTVGDVVLPSRVRALPHSADRGPSNAVVLVVDTSGSMAGERIVAARAAAADFAAGAPPSVRLGLVAVADRPDVVLAPSADRAAFISAVGRLTASGGTALHDGIATALDLLDPDTHPAAGDFVQRQVVVLSDGADTASTRPAARLVEDLAQAPATVDAVAFGAEADRRQLTAFSAATGGQVFEAGDPAALRSVFRTMAAGLSAPVLVSATVAAGLAGRNVTLHVEAALVGGAVAVTEVPVGFRPDPRAGAAPAPFTVPAAGATGLVTVLVVVATALFAGCLLVLRPVTARGHVRRRLRELDAFMAGGTATTTVAAAAGGGHVLRAALAVSERAIAEPDRRERIELALDRAGLQLRAAEWQLIRAVSGVGAAVLLCAALPWWAGLPAGLPAGWFGAGRYLRFRAGRRTRAFANQLPDALQLVVGSLRSGFSLAQSIDALVRNGEDPVAGELGRALAETRLGGDLEDALDRVGQRNASQDLAWLVMAIRIQREVGGNLSEVLETAVATMRERGQLARHVRALSAEGRLSGLILLAMPILLGGWMFVFRRDYLEPLYTQAVGILMLVAAVILVGVGALWLRKIVQVRV